MSVSYSVLIGKAVRSLARIRGGGSALPGLVIEKIDPQFISRTLASLPCGVVVISGTNGKTTTTKMVVELLESQGLKVFTNPTGSNFTRGVGAALLGEIDNNGQLEADIAVLELDEAHAVHFVKSVHPRYSLLLNVMRDQLDRFGEIDQTARLLEKIAAATTDVIVTNREDARLSAIAKTHPEKTVFFGLDASLHDQFPTDNDLRSDDEKQQPTTVPTRCTLRAIDGQRATYELNGAPLDCHLKLSGVYNIYNSAAALALVSTIVKSPDIKKMQHALETMTPAFGRGETITVNNQPLELVLVKNPAGFQLSLSSFVTQDKSYMIAINDAYADGRDMSWLWDVEFDCLRTPRVSTISGTRAYDMGLRLQYDNIVFGHIEPSIGSALRTFIADNPSQPKVIFATYTAMLAIRKKLGEMTEMEKVL